MMFHPEGADDLLMIPGPTPVDSRILAALGQPTIAHTSTSLAAIIRRCQDGVRALSGSTEGSVFLVAGAGTLAQEAAIVNLVAPGERLLVASNGFFGDRFASIGAAHGIQIDHLRSTWGRSITPEQLDTRLATSPAKAVTLTHVDTSTGVAAPVENLAAVARRHGALVILDAVCSLGGMPVDMDQNSIDVVLTGAQKALGLPPGLAIVIASARAMETRAAMPAVTTYYADLLNWQASMRDPTQYFSTHAVNHFYALAVALDIIDEEGVAARFLRHVNLAQSFRSRAHVMGFQSLTSQEVLSPTLSVFQYPPGAEDEAFRRELLKRGVVAAGCLGPWRGRGVRFGHMGNVGEGDISRALNAMEAALQRSSPDSQVDASRSTESR